MNLIKCHDSTNQQQDDTIAVSNVKRTRIKRDGCDSASSFISILFFMSLKIMEIEADSRSSERI